MTTQQQPSESKDNVPPRVLKGRELQDFEWLQSVTLDSIVLDADMTQVVSINGFDFDRLNQKCLRRLCVKFKIANYKNRNKEKVLQLILERRLRMLRIERAMAQQRKEGSASSGEASSDDMENASQNNIQQDALEKSTPSVHALCVNNNASASVSSANSRSRGKTSEQVEPPVQASFIDNNSTLTFSFENMSRLPVEWYAPYTAALAAKTIGCNNWVGGRTMQQGAQEQTTPSVHAVSVDNNASASASSANSRSGGATSELPAGSHQASSFGDNVTSPFSFVNMNRLPVARYAPYTEATRTITREIPGTGNEGKSALTGRESILKELELLVLMEEYDTSLKRKREELDGLIQQTHEAREMIDILKKKRSEALAALQSGSSSM